MAQFLQQKVFDGGLNSDSDFEFVAAGDYLDAKNIKTYGGVENIVGNQQIQLKDLDGTTNFSLSSSYAVVGVAKNTLRDSLIYLIANTSGNHLITEFSQITGIHKIIVKCGTNAASAALNLSTTVQSHNPRIINRADTSEEGDLLFWLDKDGVPRKLNLRKAKNGDYGASILEEYTTVVKKPPMYEPLNLSLVNVANGNLTVQNKMYQFAYRYIYDDYEKSVFSPISNSLVPYYIFNETDVIPADNSIGYNAASFTIKSGSANVKNIEIIYREYFDGIWSNFYLVDTVVSTGSDISYTFTGTGQKIPLDNSDAPDVLQYDYVPLSAKAQEIVNGNVVVYGNFVEGYNKTNITASVGLTNSTYVGDNKMFFPSGLNPASNLFLNPGGIYKVGVVYLDEHGRNAGVFTNNSMILNVPHEHWDPTLLAAGTGQNWYNTRKTSLPNIAISSAAPSWAKYFRMAITEDNNYESEVVTDIIDYKYSTFTLSGATCSLTNITFPSVANGGPQNDIPFFKAYGTNQYLKITYNSCDTDTSSLIYYNTGASANSLTYRNKGISDPARMIYEYKKLVSATQSTDYTVTVDTAPTSGSYSTPISTANFSGYASVFNSVSNTWLVQWTYTGATPITDSQINVYYTGLMYGNSRLPPTSSTYITLSNAGTVNQNGIYYNDYRTFNSGDFISNVFIQSAFQYAPGTNGTITIANTTNDVLFISINSGAAVQIPANSSQQFSVPFGYTITAFKYQTVTGSTTDAYVNVSVVNGGVLPTTDSVSPKRLLARISNLGYTFQSGDELSIIYDYYKNEQPNGTYLGLGVNNKVYRIIDFLIDPDFIESDGTTTALDGNWVQIEEVAKTYLDASGDTSGATHVIGLKAKILRQKKITSTGADGDIFFEIPQTYLVSSYTPSSTIQLTLAGDCMFKSDYVVLDGTTAAPIGGKTNDVQRVFYSSVPTKNYQISEDNMSALFLAKVSKNGRPAIDDKQARQREFPATVRWSQNLEFNSNVNGLNRFLYLDFKDLDGSFGPVKRLAVRDRSMRCYQEDKVGMLPVYQSIITNAAGGTDLTLSTELFNNVQYYAGNYSIGNAVGSLVSDSYADYFVDDIRKAICRLGQEGITPMTITKSMNTWAGENIKNDATYYAGYDSDNRTVIFSSVKGADKYTISWSERLERFESFYTYYPATIASLNNVMYTSNTDGTLWIHSSSGSFCNFYGVQSQASMKLLFNENPSMKKIFMTLTEVGNSFWTADYVKGSANATASSIPYTYFRNQEGFFNAPFLRDGGVSTPTVGKPIRGNYCILELKANTPSNYVTLLILKYGYNESKIN
jgi:hypothetical protein